MRLLDGFKRFLTSWKVEEGCGLSIAQQVVGKMQQGQPPSPAGCLLIESFRHHCAAAGKSSPVPMEEFSMNYEKIEWTYAEGKTGKGWNIEQGSAWKVEEGCGYTEVEWTYLSRMQGSDGQPMLRKRPGRAKFDMGPMGYTEVEWTYLRNGSVGLTGQSIRDVAQAMVNNPKG